VVEPDLPAESSDFVLVYKDFDDGKAIYLGPWENSAMGTFLGMASLPLVNHFTPTTVSRIFGTAIPVHFFLFFESTDTASSQALDNLAVVAPEFRGEAIFTAVDLTLESSSQISEFFAVDDTTTLPTIRVFNIMTNDKFIPSGDSIDPDTWKQFLDSVLEGTVEPTYRSQEPVPYSGSGVRVLVAKDHDEIVNDPTKNVFVEYYAPWCPHCQSLEPEWDRLAAHFAGRDDIIIAKMDMTENELKTVEVAGYPTLYLFPSGLQKEPVSYDEEARDFEAFLSFLQYYLSPSSSSKDEL